MTENERFIQVVDTLKKIGFLSTDTELAEQLGTNKAEALVIFVTKEKVYLYICFGVSKNHTP